MMKLVGLKIIYAGDKRLLFFIQWCNTEGFLNEEHDLTAPMLESSIFFNTSIKDIFI